jgi:hopanoid biosynthesis associated protein HpnK
LKGLIITADDFGAAVEINEAIERAYRDGVLTAASLMVTAPCAADAVARAKRMPGLRVGLHLVLVDGRPALPATSVPSLVDDEGAFRRNMFRAGVDMFFRSSVRKQLALEIEAQFQAFAATGLELDHVNAHKHFHVHPTIAAHLVASGKRHGLSAVRVPHEPPEVLRRVDPRRLASGAYALAPFCRLLKAALGKAQITAPDQVFGLAWSGAFTQDKLQALVANLPDGLSEIYLHPAIQNQFPGSVPGYRYRDEFDALVDPSVIHAVRGSGAKLGGFADFPLRR